MISVIKLYIWLTFLWKFTKLEQVFIFHLQTYELFLQFHERIHDISWWILVRIPSASCPNNWANLGCNSFLRLLGRGKANDTEHIHQQQLWNIYEMSLNLLFMLPIDIFSPIITINMLLILPVEWFAHSSLQIFGRHQWLEDCFFVSFDAFLMVVFVHQDSLVVAFRGCKTRLKYQKYRVYFKEKKCDKN